MAAEICDGSHWSGGGLLSRPGRGLSELAPRIDRLFEKFQPLDDLAERWYIPNSITPMSR